MDAYQLVDPATRRNMEGMLKTWKESIPNSGDPTPVFPSEVTKRIENALIKAKTAAVQSQQNQARSSRSPFPLPPRPMQSSGLPHRNTPTPPQQNNMYSIPPTNSLQGQYGNPAQPDPHTNQQVCCCFLPALSPCPNAQCASSLLPFSICSNTLTKLLRHTSTVSLLPLRTPKEILIICSETLIILSKSPSPSGPRTLVTRVFKSVSRLCWIFKPLSEASNCQRHS